MNQKPASVWQRDLSPAWSRRLSRWLFSWRGVRRILISLAWVVTIIALYYAEENFRGRRAWTIYRSRLEARGEQLDLKAFIPAPVRDEDNFAAIPFVRSWFDKETRGNPTKLWNDTYSVISPQFGSKRNEAHGERRFLDLVAWEKAFRASESGHIDSYQYSPGALDLAARSNAAPAVLESLKSVGTFMPPFGGAGVTAGTFQRSSRRRERIC